MNDSQLHENFSHYGANAKEWIRKCQMLLPEIARRQIWRKKGFSCIYEYAAKLAGMSRHSVDIALRVLQRIEGKPALQRIAEEKGVGSVRPIAYIATEETQDFWAKKAKEMSKHTLATYVKNYREKSGPGATSQPEKISENESEPVQREIVMQLKPELARKLAQLQKREDFENLLEEFMGFVEMRVEKEKPEPVRSESRYVPAKIKRFVLKKTGGKCAFPGCMREHESLHHTQRFAAERVHDPDRLVPLCKAHERIAHLGLIENEDGQPEEWRLREEADLLDHKRYVDQFVGLYR